MNTEDILFNIIVLGIGRSLDLLSTWYGSPNFDMELNSWVKKVGWKKLILINIILVAIFSILTRKGTIFFGAISTLVALRNFQVGRMARAMGEAAYIATSRKFIRDSPWYLPLLPIFFEVLIWMTIGIAIILLIGKHPTGNLKDVRTIGEAFLYFGLFIGGATIGGRLEKKFTKSN